MIPSTLVGCLFLMLDAFLVGIFFTFGCALASKIASKF